MAWAVDGEKCVWCLARACAQVCPVDAIYTDGRQAYIHPDECTWDDACTPECPSGAISEVADDHPLVEIAGRAIRGSPSIVNMGAMKTRRPLERDAHRRLRDELLLLIGRAVRDADREDLLRAVEEWIPQEPGGHAYRRDPPPEARQALIAILQKSFPDRAQQIVEDIRSLTALDPRPRVTAI